MTWFEIVNTQTGEVIAGPFATAYTANEEMLRLFPVVEPWNGVEQPYGVREVHIPSCEFTWANGWGGHECWRPQDHEGRHVCKCDAEVIVV